MKYISIDLFACNNLTDNITCKREEEIKDFFVSPYKFFTAYYHDSQVDKYNGRSYCHCLQNKLSINRYKYVEKNQHFYEKFRNNYRRRMAIFFEKNLTNLKFALSNTDFQSRLTWSSQTFQILFYAGKEKLVSRVF